MAENKIDSMVASTSISEVTAFSVDSQSTDGPTDQKETIWMDENWDDYLGYYKDEKTPEITSVIDTGANWVAGKGYEADEETTMLLDTIRGNGFDTFNSIMENGERTKELGGNFYAEIVRDDEDNFINLKPLDPLVMKHVANPQGIIIRFEQISKVPGGVTKKFKPEQIFYLPRNRIADEIHGTGDIESITGYLDKIKQLDEEKLMEEYSRQIYQLSHIAKEKFKFLRWSIYFLIINMGLTIFFLILSSLVNVS
ncbi:hypothetical protein LCGC14_2439400 [marine sediment metagenome]|uniref:Pycsar effector protein domain-containing protein n=1 Tax=marine sediment metagenome TaxID=412755 RepID=A0A0F9C6V7_9ZZZZ